MGETADDLEAPRRRGGVVKGAWKSTTPDGLRDFRKTHKVSRARLARTLGVSSTTIQNWETGADVASVKAQAKLADVMRDGASMFPPRLSANDPALGATIATTGEIVEGYLRSLARPIDREALIELIRNVRLALS
jgi:DNA-binding XRE family transcriptional regulator